MSFSKGLPFPGRSGKVLFVVLLLLASLGAVAGGLLGIHAHTDPVEMDTVSYLESALDIRETGGWLKIIPNCLNGTYREATQHPVYLIALSFFAARGAAFFVAAKALTFVIGLIFLAVLFLTVRRILGKTEAVLAVLFFILSATFLRLTTMVAVESVFTLFILLFWYCAARGFQKKAYWLWAGAAASLAFLSKSLGVLTIPAFLLSVLIVERKKTFGLIKDKHFLGFFLVFLLIASPLFIRNAKVYGAVLYSDSSEVLWLDNWHDYGRERPDGKTPSLSTYLEDHRPSEVMKTLAAGLFLRNARMISDGLKPFRFWGKLDLETLTGFQKRTVPWQDWWAVLVVLFFLYGIFRVRKEPHAVVGGVCLLAFLVFVGWYSKVFAQTMPTRLLYPVIFLIVVYAGSGLANLAASVRGGAWHSLWKDRALPCVAGLFIIVYLLSLLCRFDWRDLEIAKSYRFNPIFVTQLKWMEEHAGRGEKVLVGQIFAACLFYVRDSLKAEAVEWPKRNTMSEIEKFIRDEDVRYGFIDLATVVNNSKPFGEYFEVFRKRMPARVSFRTRKPLPSLWKRLLQIPPYMPIYEIYAFQEAG